MATYQFKIEFLSKKWAENNKFNPKLLYETKQEEGVEQYDLPLASEIHDFDKELDDLISNILPKGQSWHTNLLIWGNEERSDIKVWLEEQKVESITIRLDLRDDIVRLLDNIIALAVNLDCVIFVPETKQIINPTLLELQASINKSSAARFIEDPVNFLKINSTKDNK